MELANAMRMLGNLPTAIQQINYPIHKGQPNPAHGKFYFVGKVPVACTEGGKSKRYDTEAEAVAAAFAAGVERVQKSDYTWATNG